MAELDVAKTIIFYFFSTLILLFALLSIFSMKTIHSIIFSVVVFISVSGLFFLLGADYNAVIQIGIYGIIVPVLFLIAFAYTDRKKNRKLYLTTSPRLYLSFLSLGFLFITLVYLISISLTLDSNSEWIFQKQTLTVNKFEMLKMLAEGAFSNYLIPFELLSFLLLIIVTGLSVFNFREGKTDEQ